MNYCPEPIDTSQVILPKNLLGLKEHLAEHVHDVWATRRLAEGWSYGPLRDDVRKEHPGLIPYSDLSESEKEYDRATVVESLKAIIALGYEIRGGNTEEE